MSDTLKKKTSLRTIWSDEMENMLLDLWEEKIEELRGARKNSHVYQEIASAMQDAEFQCGWIDIRTKIDNLTRKYKMEKNKIGPTGGTPSSWAHYAKVHNILGSFKLHNIELYMHESTDMSSLLNESTDFGDLNASCSSFSPSEFNVTTAAPSKKRKADVNNELLTLAKERMEILKQQQQERNQQVMEMLKRLDTISNQNSEFQSKLLEILRNKN